MPQAVRWDLLPVGPPLLASDPQKIVMIPRVTAMVRRPINPHHG